MKLQNNLLLLGLIIYSLAGFSQISDYHYERKIEDISEQWHRIELPNDVVGKLNQNMSDLRIYGYTNNQDTLEAPYILNELSPEIVLQAVPFKMINQSKDEEGYFITFQVGSNEEVNQIKLNFSQPNFDWKIRLEGSQDLEKWFTILDDYRILSIQNELTDYTFSTLDFPSSTYKYFRLFIPSNEEPNLESAYLERLMTKEGVVMDFSVTNLTSETNKSNKKSEVTITLSQPERVNRITVNVGDDFDYFRPVVVEYLQDSVKIDDGWLYNYRHLTGGTLSSIQENQFEIPGITLQKLRLIIDNHDNQPLNISSVEVQGYQHELVARFSDKAIFYLVYGNPKAQMPYYDIVQFANTIPQTLTTVQLGKERNLKKDEIVKEKKPLFNQAWLWFVMITIIVILGWFSFRMIKNFN